ncbi:AP-1 complex subunit mu-1 [Caligus rogercresseyi]|uniref:AP-1 complex subunit mu-1 n=1 Tax=Caligus rogercresseyi TaxID=217165 RepID=A0A7T8K1T3_CALRO|nr:AP-1 complex subunit mu-1 [Caligus rogercresseyi]
MVLSAIYILDMKGKVLINRNYRGDIENNVIEKFIGQTTIAEEEGSTAPLLSTSDGVTFAYIKRNTSTSWPPPRKTQTLP